MDTGTIQEVLRASFRTASVWTLVPIATMVANNCSSCAEGRGTTISFPLAVRALLLRQRAVILDGVHGRVKLSGAKLKEELWWLAAYKVGRWE